MHLNQPGPGRGKPIAESKAFMGVKVFGADKVSYREWNESFKISYDQYRPGMSRFLDLLEQSVRGLNLDELTDENITAPWLVTNVLNKDFAAMNAMFTAEKLDEVSGKAMLERELRWILIQKTENEQKQRVKSADTGEVKPGIAAYMRLHFWNTRLSQAGMVDRRRDIMKPNVAKSESDIANSIEKLLKDLNELSKVRRMLRSCL